MRDHKKRDWREIFRRMMAAREAGPGEGEQARALGKMKTFATGLLILMALLYVASRFLKTAYPGLEVLAAFTEAAMVGALADWFAVTALFRHPLALPIPHTAIIPRNKDRFGKNLAAFIRNNFLSREAIEERLNNLDIMGWISGILSDRIRTRELAGKLVEKLPLVLEKWDDEEVRSFGRDLTSRTMGQVRLGPWLARILETVTEGSIHQVFLDRVLKITMKWVKASDPAMRGKMKERNPWWMPDFVDDKIVDRIVGKVEETLNDIYVNPDHEVRKQLDEAIQRLIKGLKDSERVEEKIRDIKERYLDYPEIREYVAGITGGLKVKLLQDLRDPDSIIRKQIEEGIFTLGISLAENEAMRKKLNVWICGSLLKLSQGHADSISFIISDTVRHWDAERTSRRIELYVGKDLQWIRINGTLVGGLVGLLIYAVSKLFG